MDDLVEVGCKVDSSRSCEACVGGLEQYCSAGITALSRLCHRQDGPGKRDGMVGIGGLGHMAIKCVKALGAHVTDLTSASSKAADAARLGADYVVVPSGL